MKNVLILAHYFPPLGMGGTQRIAKFVKFLPQFGWQPWVVTVRDIAYYAYDDSLLADVSTAKVFRTNSLDPQRLLYLLRGRPSQNSPGAGNYQSQRLQALLAWVLQPDSRLLWLPFCLRTARRLLAGNDFACCITSGPPHSLHLAGLRLQRRFGLPWIADFRDGWAGGDFQVEPTRLHRRWNARMETSVITRADHVVAVSEGLAQDFRQRHPGNENKITTLTNGYDRDDFPETVPPKVSERFKIVYSGTVSKMAPMHAFFRALARVKDLDEAAFRKLQVEIVGRDLSDGVEAQIKSLALEEVVTLSGYRPHADVVRVMVAADLLLYPVADGASTVFVPGKTFEYLASRKPILAIGPEIEGIGILREYSYVVRHSHNDVEGIARSLTRLLGRPQNAARAVNLSRFERFTLTRKLVGIMETLAAAPDSAIAKEPRNG